MLQLKFKLVGASQPTKALQEVIRYAIRPAAQSGAQVFYTEVRANVSQLGTKTGNLKNSIYQKFVPEESNATKATYHISWRKSGGDKKNGLAAAQHGYLVEYGHVQRYEIVLKTKGKYAGRWIPLVRPEMWGTPRPKRRSSQAVKDAYFLPRRNGPVQWLGAAFLRNAAASQNMIALRTAQQIINRRIQAAK